MALTTTSLSFGAGDEDIYALSQYQKNFTRFVKNLCRKELRRNPELREIVDEWIENNIGSGDLKDYIDNKSNEKTTEKPVAESKSVAKKAKSEPKIQAPKVQDPIQPEPVAEEKAEIIDDTAKNNIVSSKKKIDSNIKKALGGIY